MNDSSQETGTAKQAFRRFFAIPTYLLNLKTKGADNTKSVFNANARLYHALLFKRNAVNITRLKVIVTNKELKDIAGLDEFALVRARKALVNAGLIHANETSKRRDEYEYEFPKSFEGSIEQSATEQETEPVQATEPVPEPAPITRKVPEGRPVYQPLPEVGDVEVEAVRVQDIFRQPEPVAYSATDDPKDRDESEPIEQTCSKATHVIARPSSELVARHARIRAAREVVDKNANRHLRG